MSAGRDARDADDGGGFLGRWSERKLKARAEAAEQAPEAGAPAAAPAEEPNSEAEILEALGLPDPDTLMKGDDFSAFMQAAVPAGLRSRALRRLWLTDPVLANLDGLNDYEQDFTDAATVVKGGVKSLYRVGRGLLPDEPEEAGASAPAPGAEGAADEARAISGRPGGGPSDAAPRDGESQGQPAASDPSARERAGGEGRSASQDRATSEAQTAASEARPGSSMREAENRDRTAEMGEPSLRARRMRFRFEG